MITDEDKHPSEARYGVKRQPPPTCPMIDDALEVVENVQKRIRNYDRADGEELRAMLSDVDWNLAHLSGYGRRGVLEDIRKRCEEIRAWGTEWKDYAKDNTPCPACGGYVDGSEKCSCSRDPIYKERISPPLPDGGYA